LQAHRWRAGTAQGLQHQALAGAHPQLLASAQEVVAGLIGVATVWPVEGDPQLPVVDLQGGIVARLQAGRLAG
jgi:hypothetical protein